MSRPTPSSHTSPAADVPIADIVAELNFARADGNEAATVLEEAARQRCDVLLTWDGQPGLSTVDAAKVREAIQARFSAGQERSRAYDHYVRTKEKAAHDAWVERQRQLDEQRRQRRHDEVVGRQRDRADHYRKEAKALAQQQQEREAEFYAPVGGKPVEFNEFDPSKHTP